MSFKHSFVLLCLLCWVTATAQQPEPIPPGEVTPVQPAVPIPGTIPPRTGTTIPPRAGVTIPPRPGATIPPRPGTSGAAGAAAGGGELERLPANIPVIDPNIPLAENKITEDIIEPKLSGVALSGLYRIYTGRRVIVTSAAAAAEFSFIQEASKKDPLSFAEAAELLKKAAILENFVFVPHPNDPKIDVLTLSTGGIRPTGVGIDVLNENDELPQGDAVIAYVMTLNHIKPEEAINIFTQIIGQFGAFGSIAAVPNASAIIITENTSLIRKLIDLKKEIDKPGSVQATRFIPVQYADVTEIADTITELLTAQQTAQKTAGVQRSGAMPPTGGAPPQPGTTPIAQSTSGGGEDAPVQILPDPRTNRIFVMGRPVDILFVEGLVREFDVPTSDKTFLRRKLRFLTVSEFLPIAGDALTRAFTGTGQSGGSAGSGGSTTKSQGGRSQARSQQTSSGSPSSGLGGSSSGFGGSSSSYGGNNSGYGGSSSRGSSGSSRSSTGLADTSVSSAPESLLVGRTLLVADNITNSIVAQGPPSALEIIERLLDQIDVKPDQVLISTVIGQLTLNDSQETGVNYLYRGGEVLGGGGGGIPAFKPITSTDTTKPTATTNSFPTVDLSSMASSGLRMYGKIDNLGIFLKALQNKSDFTVLSRPSIFTSNNVKGTISSGERIAIPTGSNSYGGVNGSSTQIEYQDVVLKLEVIPLVNSDKEITMQISLLNDEQNGTQTIQGGGGNGGDLTVPRISTRELLTTATVPNGQTIVLGGLIVGRDTQAKSGIPILCDIPYLGRLFSTVTDNKDRSELMIFIQPSIVNNASSLDAVQTDMDRRYRGSPKVRDFADGDGVLPGVDDIPRVEEKGKGGSSGQSADSSANPASGTTKRNLGAVHRR